MSETDHFERFAAQLPYFLNGTLDDAEAQLIRRYLQEDPRAQREWALATALQQASLVPNDPALDELRWQSLRPHLTAPQRTSSPRPGLWQRMWSWQVPVPAFASVCLTVALGWILWPVAQTLTPSENRSVDSPLTTKGTSTPCSQQWRARVVFEPQVTTQETVIRIRSAGVHRIGVPTALGEWWLYWQTEVDRRQGLESLKSAQMTQSVLVPGLETALGCHTQ